jgi:hypothetical protein
MDGQEIGILVPFLYPSSSVTPRIAVLAHRDSADATFPEGWLIPSEPVLEVFFSSSGCTGTPMLQLDPTRLFDNMLYWTPGAPNQLFKANGSGASMNSALSKRGINGGCLAVSVTAGFTVATLTSFNNPVANSKPWTVVLQ